MRMPSGLEKLYKRISDFVTFDNNRLYCVIPCRNRPSFFSGSATGVSTYGKTLFYYASLQGIPTFGRDDVAIWLFIAELTCLQAGRDRHAPISSGLAMTISVSVNSPVGAGFSTRIRKLTATATKKPVKCLFGGAIRNRPARQVIICFPAGGFKVKLGQRSLPFLQKI